MTRILHLSDLHFGTDAASDVDEKARIDLASRRSRHNNAKSRIRSLAPAPDFVIVSGDITLYSAADGFDAFNAFCDELIEADALPPASRFLIVPGNHDVKRLPPFGDMPESARWKDFCEAFGRFAHPWISSITPNADPVKVAVNAFADDFAGGIVREDNKKLEKSTLYPLPFIFDPNAGVLIYGFNSAAVSGSREVVPDDIKKAVGALDVTEPNVGNWQSVRGYLGELVSIDPAQVRDDELLVFHSITTALARRYPEAYRKALKIAVLHHHVAPIQAEEIKRFELLINAWQFKSDLSEKGFEVICHGHKHMPAAFRDAEAPGGGHQVIVAGGTIGGYTPAGVSPGFHLIDCNDNTVSVQFVPLNSVNGDTAERRWEFTRGVKTEQKNAPARRIGVRRITTEAANAITRAFRSVEDESGAIVEGWSHRVGESNVTATSTAFALRLLRLATPIPEAWPLISKALATIEAFRHPEGGWSSNYEMTEGMPESTGWVALALHDWGVKVDQQELERILGKLLDDKDPGHALTFSIAHAITVLTGLYAASTLLEPLVTLLTAGALRNGDAITGWAAELKPGEYSALHSAYACIALQRLSAGSRVDLSTAREKLRTAPWIDTDDEVNRAQKAAYGKLTIMHYTAPIAVRALLDLGVSPLDNQISQAVADIAAQQKDGLWRWRGGDRKPVWLTYDAVAALNEWADQF